MCKKKTLEEFKEELSQINNSIEIIGEYRGNNIKILCLCKKCNQEFQSRPSDLLNGHGCKQCAIKMRSEKRKYTHEDFIEKLKAINPQIEPLETYKTSREKILCKCRICNHTWMVRPHDLFSGYGCPKCAINKCKNAKRWSTSTFVERLKEQNDSVILLSEYKNYNSKVLVKCKLCNNIFETTPHTLLGGHGCKICANKRVGDIFRKDKDKFISQLKEINPNIKILSEYINSKTNVKCMCSICGNVWDAIPNNILRGAGCSKCKSSKGEKIISDYLSNNKVSFIRQYKFDDCKHKRALPFDFYLPDYNMAIEYDGELHYKSVEYFGGDESLKGTQYRDDIKTQYCYENNIRLLRIPYWCYDDIEKILKRELEVV